MTKFTFPVKSFKRFDEPHQGISSRTKYRFYVEVKDVPAELMEWMDTNPREQKLSTDVAKDILASLQTDNKSFHLWNRGILLSADEITFDNKTSQATLIMLDPRIHGNIDGGHTLRIIIDHDKNILANPNTYFKQYVEFEVITGIDSTVLLAEARNTSTPVDTISIEELRKSFNCIKDIIGGQQIKGDLYSKRISFKQNEHHNNPNIKNIIDIRELIAIINMFCPTIYSLSGGHPIQSYTGKETSLRKFLNMGLSKDALDADKKARRETEISKMTDIIPDVIRLWDSIECELPDISKKMNKRYGRKAYSNYKKDDNDRPIVAGKSMFSNQPVYYSVPKGLMYPMVGAFRALVRYNDITEKYEWVEDPFIAWENLSEQLIDAIMNSSSEQNDNPNAIGKSLSTWDVLFNKVYIYSLEKQANIR